MANNKELFLKITLIAGIGFALISLFSPCPLLCVPAFFTLYCIVFNLTTFRFHAAFFLAFIYQWSQVSIKVLYATLTLTDIHTLTRFPSHIVEAYLLSCFALIIISYAISIYLKKIKFVELKFEDALTKLRFRNVLLLYFLINIVADLIGRISGLLQAVSVIYPFKWGLFFLLFAYCLRRKSNMWILLLLVGYEIVAGFYSYFASWKMVIFYLFISLAALVKFRIKHIVMTSLGIVLTLGMAIMWTGVKNEYRSFLAQGGKQTVVTSSSEAYGKFFELVSSFHVTPDVQREFLDRMSYIDYFSSCLAYVPEKQGHEYGKLTKDAILHILQPRIFFPDKGVINESAHLTKYTGKYYSGYDQGVSFSLGYIADFYIDYGPYLMFPMLFIWGTIMGWFFYRIIHSTKEPLIASAILATSFTLLYKFEISMMKLVGNMIMFWLVYLLCTLYVLPEMVNFIRRKSN